MSVTTVVVTDGLIRAEKGYAPHPSLQPWLQRLQRARRSWFISEPRTPLGWYGWLQQDAPAAFLAAALPIDQPLPFNSSQFWVASPCSLQLSRDQVRVMPESLLSFDERDARWLCEMLNPLLAEDEMQLVAVGRSLCLCSRRRYDVHPLDFALINSRSLPAVSPAGSDGARWMRLQAEIQMLLHREQPLHRSGQPPLQGLWFWGMAEHAATSRPLAVATCNATLGSIVNGQGAHLCLTEADRAEELIGLRGPQPHRWLLAGDAHALLLKCSGLPLLRKSSWLPKGEQPEAALRQRLS